MNRKGQVTRLKYLAVDISSLFIPVDGSSDGVLAGMFRGISGGVGERHDNKPNPIFCSFLRYINERSGPDVTVSAYPRFVSINDVIVAKVARDRVIEIAPITTSSTSQDSTWLVPGNVFEMTLQLASGAVRPGEGK